MNSSDKGVTAAGFAGGNLLNLVAIVNGTDLAKTAILAVVGAVVSFVITMLLKKITAWRRAKPPRQHRKV
ncbi:mannitol-specific phosphotransferase system IIBC component [Filimonas zeae]|uniref:Uncharacterized protein n=1 Tax=Filimonas zeae TaxID=1737353 RepID=A0A917MV63_9BACT|nr:hypothetical protein [Filimonas zeae]MDR6338962.1 mannitol-specific phosphotransferase system IIBC component [Filimonas zeae]GGH65759.1 hypothetical protein GCM10011379_19240 [Filimonas zeae]